MFVESNGGGGGGASNSFKVQKMSVVAKKVYEHLRSAPQNNEGLHVNVIAQQMHIQASDVFKAGDELLGEGLIFTTVDDETWAVLDC